MRLQLLDDSLAIVRNDVVNDDAMRGLFKPVADQ